MRGQRSRALRMVEVLFRACRARRCHTQRASSNDFEGATPCWSAGRRRRSLIAEPRALHSSNCMALSTAAKKWSAANYQGRPNVISRQLSTAAKRGQQPTPLEHDACQHAAQVFQGRRRIQLEYSSMAMNCWMGLSEAVVRWLPALMVTSRSGLWQAARSRRARTVTVRRPLG